MRPAGAEVDLRERVAADVLDRELPGAAERTEGDVHGLGARGAGDGCGAGEGGEAGEGEMNAAFAGSVGVPVILAAGDSVFTVQFRQNVPTRTVITKTAVTPVSARLKHPEVVRSELAAATREALENLGDARPWQPPSPLVVRIQFADVTRPQIMEAVPGVRQVDGYTVEFTAQSMADAYRLIRFLYRFVVV